MSAPRALVTGGAGFIGSNLVDALLAEGYAVRVIDNLATGRLDNLAGCLHDIEFLAEDIRDESAARRATSDCDVVFHAAALGSVPRSVADPLTSTMTNVIGTLNVLIGARDSDVGRFVFASSSSVYGANLIIPKVETLEPQPMSPYAATKLAGEGFCASFWHVHGLETVVLRYFNVFGPRQNPALQYAAVVPLFIDSLLSGVPPTINGDGLQTRDFTYVDDIVRGNLLAARTPGIAGRKYNVSCGHQVTVMDLYREVASLVDSDLEPLYGPTRDGDMRDTFGSSAAAAADLGFSAEISMTEGLRRTVAHIITERSSKLPT